MYSGIDPRMQDGKIAFVKVVNLIYCVLAKWVVVHFIKFVINLYAVNIETRILLLCFHSHFNECTQIL